MTDRVPNRSEAELGFRKAASVIRRAHKRGKLGDHLTPEFALAIAEMMGECANAEHELEGEGGRMLKVFLDEWEAESGAL